MTQGNGAPQADGLSSASPMEPRGSPPKASIPSALVDLVETLRQVHDGKRNFERGFSSPYSTLVALGLVAEESVKKSCRSCGHAVHDYSYSHLTLAGQAYLALASGIEAATADETGTGSAEGESPVAKPDARKPGQSGES